VFYRRRQDKISVAPITVRILAARKYG